MAEQIRFPIVGEDRGATRVLKDVGRESAVTAAQTRILAESLDKEKRAATAATDALLKVEKAAALVAITERKLDEEARRAELALRGEANAAQKLGRASADAAGKGGLAALIGGGGLQGGGMAALVAAGGALSPVLVTVGTGLGGLGLAALSAGKRSKDLQQELVPLKTAFKAFGDAVEPTLVTDFAAAARLAGQVLHDIRPVTVATGKAMADFLGQLGKNFQGQEWQQFFQFMANTAGPDVRLLGQNFTALATPPPPLLEQLQPLAVSLLHLTDRITTPIQGQAAPSHSQEPLRYNHHAVFSWKTVGDAIHRTVNFIAPGVPVLQRLADQQQKSATAAGHAADSYTAQAKALNVLAAGYEHALTPLENYIGAQITEAN